MSLMKAAFCTDLTDDTYQIARNIHSQLYDIDDSMHDDDRIGLHGVKRNQDAFVAKLIKQGEIASKIQDAMGIKHDTEVELTTLQHDNHEIISRMDKLDDSLSHEACVAHMMSLKEETAIDAEFGYMHDVDYKVN